MKNATICWCAVIVLISAIGGIDSHRKICEYTPTVVKGSKAPRGPICKGQLLLDEQFRDFDRDLWQHEITLSGGGVSVLLNILGRRKHLFIRRERSFFSWYNRILLIFFVFEFRIGSFNGTLTIRKIHTFAMENYSFAHH